MKTKKSTDQKMWFEVIHTIQFNNYTVLSLKLRDTQSQNYGSIDSNDSRRTEKKSWITDN